MGVELMSKFIQLYVENEERWDQKKVSIDSIRKYSIKRSKIYNISIFLCNGMSLTETFETTEIRDTRYQELLNELEAD
jgi:hypothetical protein